jgi:Ca-activated chloride channel family protein
MTFLGIDINEGRLMFLTLLALTPLIWWRWSNRGGRPAMRFSSLENLRRRGTTWAVRARFIVPLLRTLAVLLLIVCLLGPQKGDEETRITSEGIAIQLLVDRSGSMIAEDFQIEGKRVNRLDAIKQVATAFVLGDTSADLGGRPDDLIGMIAFASYADSICPLTLDHSYLCDTLSKTEIVDASRYEDEDGTAIGDAIALGVLRLSDLAERREVMRVNRVKSKVLVLLTDGSQTAGDLTPQQGAELAKADDIKIYTIGVGSRGMAPMPRVFMGRVQYVPTRVTIDEATLQEVAEITGGEYFRATDTASLKHIYARIDELEKTETEEKRYLQHTELATHAVTLEPSKLPSWLAGLPAWARTTPPLLVAVIVLVALEIVLVNTRFRKIP